VSSLINSTTTVFIAHPQFIEELKKFIHLNNIEVLKEHELFFWVQGDWNCPWAATKWISPQTVTFESISEAAKILKEQNGVWSLYSLANHRRASLIGDKLRLIKSKLISYQQLLPKAKLGAYSLLDDQTLIFATETTSPFPDGKIEFLEDKINPPSRAYLKLWEVLTLYPELTPKANSLCLDMGACPGGWTWVLAELGCQVISVDKAPIDERLMQNPMVTFKQESAFGLRPQHIGNIDWFYSDIICYPEKLYELVTRWIDSGFVQNFVCTIKFQAQTDYAIMQKFLEISHSKIVHLYHNKHEVTWIRCPDVLT